MSVSWWGLFVKGGICNGGILSAPQLPFLGSGQPVVLVGGVFNRIQSALEASHALGVSLGSVVRGGLSLSRNPTLGRRMCCS